MYLCVLQILGHESVNTKMIPHLLNANPRLFKGQNLDAKTLK